MSQKYIILKKQIFKLNCKFEREICNVIVCSFSSYNQYFIVLVKSTNS